VGEEARRLTATELPEYTARVLYAPRCLLARTRASRLDDLVTMLIRFIARIEAKAAPIWSWHRERRRQVTELVAVLRDITSSGATRRGCESRCRIDAIFHERRH